MFLSLIKYFRQTYEDLLDQARLDAARQHFYSYLLKRFFDRVELGFCMEWVSLTENEKTSEMQASIRSMTCEKNRYLSIFESIRLPVAIMDGQSRIRIANCAWMKTFSGQGKTGAGLYANKQELPFPSDLEDKLHPFACGNGTREIFDCTLITPAGERHFEANVEKIAEIGGELDDQVLILKDVTRRKMSEQLLRKAHEDLETLVLSRTMELEKTNQVLLAEIAERKRIESSLSRSKERLSEAQRLAQLGHWDFDIGDQELAWSTETGRISGLSSDQSRLDFDQLLAMIHPDDRDFVKNAVRQAIAENRNFNLAHRLVRPSGGVRNVQLRGELVSDQAGHPTRIIGTIQDITEQKKAEESHARLVTAIESAADTIVITDDRGIIQYVNPGFERTSGYQRGEAIGRDLHYFEGDPRDSNFYSSIRKKLSESDCWSGQIRSRHKNGTQYQEECTITAVRSRTGKIVNFVSVKRDVTERMRLEALARAVSTMKNIGYVFAGLRHEIGNPINAIKMTMGLVKKQLENGNNHKTIGYIERALEEVSKVQNLLEALKNFNMFENLKPRTVPLEDFVTKLIGLVRSDCQDLGISLSYRIDEMVTSCLADPRALQQVMLNILTNSCEACGNRPDAEISIDVSVNQGMVCIAVSDNGCGMDLEQQALLFRPFTPRKNRGTGLGLMIARKMLAGMNGTIDIKSSQDAGTRVLITLPEVRGGN